LISWFLRNTFTIDKKTRNLIKRKNTLSKKVASSSDPAIRQEYNRVRNNVKGSAVAFKILTVEIVVRPEIFVIGAIVRGMSITKRAWQICGLEKDIFPISI
jgi:hypothetical protein